MFHQIFFLNIFYFKIHNTVYIQINNNNTKNKTQKNSIVLNRILLCINEQN